jgi:hypothetical protein
LIPTAEKIFIKVFAFSCRYVTKYFVIQSERANTVLIEMQTDGFSLGLCGGMKPTGSPASTLAPVAAARRIRDERGQSC